MPQRKNMIHKRKDGRWEGRFFKERRADGKIRYTSVYARSYREVKEKLSAAVLAAQQNEPVKKSGMTVKDVGDRWLTNCMVLAKPSTAMKYAFLQNAHNGYDEQRDRTYLDDCSVGAGCREPGELQLSVHGDGGRSEQRKHR